MKLLSPFVGFLLLALWMSTVAADISLTLKNKQYLPPPIQELPIKDNYYNIQEDPQLEQKFEENNYANSRYEAFEVHNPYELSRNRGGDTQKSSDIQTHFANNNYSPLQKTSVEEIHVEHMNAADFPLDDPNLDASYLSLVTGSDDINRQNIVQHETKYSTPVPSSANYNRAFPKKSYEDHNFSPVQQSFDSVEKYQSQQVEVNKFKSSDYLPPRLQLQEYSRDPVHNSLATQVYQTSQQSQHKSDANKLFKGPVYLPPLQTILNNAASFKGSEYLPPQQHGSSQSHQKVPDYLLPGSEHQHQQSSHQRSSSHSSHSDENFEQNTPFESRNYLTLRKHVTDQSKPNSNIKPQFTGPDYLPPKQQQQPQQFPYKGPEYLPPQINFNNPDYLPPHQEKSVQQENKMFQGPEYLPPGKPEDVNIKFKGPDYLPPHQEQQVKTIQNGPDNIPPHQQLQQTNCESNKSLKCPDYLPPHQLENYAPHKGSDYLPPLENHVQQHQLQVESLPPGYDFERPSNAEEAITELHKLPEESQTSKVPVAVHEESSNIVHDTPKQEGPSPKDGILSSDYNFQQSENPATTINIKSVKDSKYSFPVYHFQKIGNSEHAMDMVSTQQNTHYEGDNVAYSADQNINQLHGRQNSDEIKQEEGYQTSQSYQSKSHQNYQTPKYQGTDQHYYPQVQNQEENKQFQAPKSIQQEPESSLPFTAPDYLPPTGGSSKYKDHGYLPPHESQNFKEPDYLLPTGNPQTFKVSEYLPPSSGYHLFKGPDYLPPTTRFQNYKASERLSPVVFNGHDHLPPVSVQQSYQRQFKGPDYLPPTDSTSNQGLNSHVMHPLSIYMTNVKSSDRYGNRLPFPELELSPAKTTTFSATTDLSSLYRKLASRPQYYAPTISYINNEFNDQTSSIFTQNKYQYTPSPNQQARRSVQHFMPKDVRQTAITSFYNAPGTLKTTKTSKGKIRTVQIVNPNANAIKTLKVLESLDHTGIKTIKILGPSDKQPIGDHRVVNVVSGSQEQSIQTLKIFNDHPDDTTSTSDATAVGQNKSHLPPTGKHNLNNTTKAKRRHRI